MELDFLSNLVDESTLFHIAWLSWSFFENSGMLFDFDGSKEYPCGRSMWVKERFLKKGGGYAPRTIEHATEARRSA